MEKNWTHSDDLISKEELVRLLREHDEQQERLDKLDKAGLRLWDSDLIEYGNMMFERLIRAQFTKEGYEWIFWWLYELPSLSKMMDGPYATDENGDPIPTEILDDLWKLVEPYRK